jgi:protoporphyrinogen/coproporphyrinogen III oxidase
MKKLLPLLAAALCVLQSGAAGAVALAPAPKLSPISRSVASPFVLPGALLRPAPRVAPLPKLVPGALKPLARPLAVPHADPQSPTPLPNPEDAPKTIDLARELAGASVETQVAALEDAYVKRRPETSVSIEDALADGQKLSIRVMGDEDSEPADQKDETDVDVHKTYDTVIVGAGLAGLSAAWHLRHKNVLVLDRGHHLGGLAAYGETRRTKITYGRGAAYYTKPTDEVAEIYKDIGLTELDHTEIPEPIDSLVQNGRLIKGMWESEEFFKQVDPGFKEFRDELVKLDESGALDFNPPGPIPEAVRKYDLMSAEQWLRKFDSPQLSNLLDSYTQSALGGHLNQVSALALMLFYSDEITTRYTWAGGTGGAAAIMAQKLADHDKKMFRTRSHVEKVINTPDGVEVIYERDGKQYRVKAKNAIVATTLNVTRKIVPEMHPTMQRLIDSMQYAHYLIHNVFTEKDYFKESYDTWFSGYGAYPFTDVIAGRWMETQGFKVESKGKGILTIYQPIAPPFPGDILSPKSVAELAKRAVQALRALVPELAQEKKIEVESFRWPNSIHVVSPGFLSRAEGLTVPIGKIHLANNNQGLPSFETALLEGRRAAREILKTSTQP